jgi:mRNA-degrading endonuclease YafQ of YafQ-DinJ toxin-antitoxin module
MNNKIESLKDLIQSNELAVQQKINKIIQTLIRTEDPSRARFLSEEILKGNFEDLEEQSIDDLIAAFKNESNNNSIASNSVKEIKNEEKIYNENDNSEDKKIKTLEYQIRVLQSQLDSAEYNNNKRIKQLEETNNKLIARLSLTKNFKLIEVSDEDINELYIRYLQTEEINYKNAIIINGIVPKTYYKINNKGE